MDSPKRVLVTNDDGIDSPGVAALAAMVAEAGFVPVVAAPAINWSGAAAALGPLDDPSRVAVRRVELPGLEDWEVSAVEAPPALIVMLAMLGGFGDLPDLVVSGVNQGPNTGRSTLHSATVAAALVAAKFERSALAVSLGDGADDHHGLWRWETATQMAAPLLQWLPEAPAKTVLNLNVPNIEHHQVLGLHHCDLAPVGGVHTSIVGRDEHGIDIDLLPTSGDIPHGTDSAWLRKGYATVTALAPPSAQVADLPVEGWHGPAGL